MDDIASMQIDEVVNFYEAFYIMSVQGVSKIIPSLSNSTEYHILKILVHFRNILYNKLYDIVHMTCIYIFWLW